MILTFSLSEKLEARHILKTRNYYTLSIYKKQLPYSNENTTFSFSELMRLIYFDEFLRHQISQFTYRIEEMLKTTVITSACVNYKGPYCKGECYLDEKLYLNSKVYDDVLASFERIVQENKSSLAIKHHLDKKQGRFPLWVLTEVMSFGQVTFFFSALESHIKKNWAYYGFLSQDTSLKTIKGEELCGRLFSWFSAAWFLRNLCSHNQRIYGRLFNSGRPQLCSCDIRKLKQYGKKKDDNSDLFAYLISIKNLLLFDSMATQQRWNDFLDSLEICLYQDTKLVRLSKMGFVDDWKNLLRINMEKGLKQLL